MIGSMSVVGILLTKLINKSHHTFIILEDKKRAVKLAQMSKEAYNRNHMAKKVDSKMRVNEEIGVTSRAEQDDSITKTISYYLPQGEYFIE